MLQRIENLCTERGVMTSPTIYYIAYVCIYIYVYDDYGWVLSLDTSIV